MPKGGAKTRTVGRAAMSAEGSSVAGTKARGRKMTKFADEVAGINNAAGMAVLNRNNPRVQVAGAIDPMTGVQGPNVMTDNVIGRMFPTVYSKGLSKQEQVRSLKHKAVQEAAAGGQLGGVTPYGVVTASDKDFEWILKREEIKRAIDYDRLFVNLFNPGDPAHVELMRELRPEYFEERMNFIKQIASIQVHLAEIYLTGIRSRDDLDLVIGLQLADIPANQKDPETGLPRILATPVHKLNRAEVLNVLNQNDAYTAATGKGTQLNLLGNLHPNPNQSMGLLGFRFPDKNDRATAAGAGYQNQPWPPGRSIARGGQLDNIRNFMTV